MLSTNRTIKFYNDLVHDFGNFIPSGNKCILVGAHRLTQVVMDIAVTKVSERNRTNARHALCNSFIRALNEFRNLLNWHRYIMLDAGTFEALYIGKVLAKIP